MLDIFDINKELEKMGAWLLGNCATLKYQIRCAPAHQSFNEQGIITGIKPIINEKKIGYDWSFHRHYAE
jgi:Lrp/AsnC family transcriptional regulator for asnA, asnC and gidA